MINVLDYGAAGDGICLDTEALQKAVDEAYARGGGTVLLPGGHTYRCGSLILRSNVELHLESGAVLKASDDLRDLKNFGQVTKDEKDDVPTYINCEYNGMPANFFLYAKDAENVRITGFGTIDGTEEIYYGKGDRYLMEGAWYPRTPLLFLENIRHLTVRDVTLTRSAFWTLHMVGCEDVLVEGIRILNSLMLANCDGIDPDHCRNVRIANCHIETADDCIVLKTSGAYRQYGPCENIVISGCTLVSTSAAVKFGTESECDFRNVIVKGCCISRTNRAVSLQLRDGGNIENVEISDLMIQTRAFSHQYWGSGEVICITNVPRHEGLDTGTIRGIRVRNIRARGESGILIYGEKEGHIADVTLSDIDLVLEKTSRWDVTGYDLRPCDGGGKVKSKIYGLYVKNAEGLRTENVTVSCSESFGQWYGGERLETKGKV